MLKEDEVRVGGGYRSYRQSIRIWTFALSEIDAGWLLCGERTVEGQRQK